MWLTPPQSDCLTCFSPVCAASSTWGRTPEPARVLTPAPCICPALDATPRPDCSCPGPTPWLSTSAFRAASRSLQMLLCESLALASCSTLCFLDSAVFQVWTGVPLCHKDPGEPSSAKWPGPSLPPLPAPWHSEALAKPCPPGPWEPLLEPRVGLTALSRPPSIHLSPVPPPPRPAPHPQGSSQISPSWLPLPLLG